MIDIKEYFKRNRKYAICSVTAMAVLGASCFAGTNYRSIPVNDYQQEVLAENESVELTPEEKDALVDDITSKLSVTEKDVYKDETVYAFADASGKVDNIVVSEWLRNPDKKSELVDKTDLKDIENVKGDEAFSQSGDTIKWQANGNDIYYQGTTDKELPVSVNVTYYLDGKETKASDMAGKSGKVTIRFDYTNNTSVEKEINGKKEDVSVPFVAISGLILDENATNIEVTNGKTMPQGGNTIVIGYAVPGLKDSLDMDDESLGDLSIPEYFEVSADVTDFSLDMTVTAVVSASEFNMESGLNTSELDDMVSQISEAGDALADGSTQLADGTATLLANMSDFEAGANQLVTGANQLKTGADSLKTGADSVNEGANQLKTGADALKTGVDAVNTGANDLKNGIDAVNTGANDLKSGADAVNTGANDLKSGADAVNTGANDLKSGVDAVNTGANDLKSGADELATGAGELKTGMDNLVTSSDSLATGVSTINQSAQSISQGVTALDTALNTQMSDEEKAAVSAQASAVATETVNSQFAEGTETYNYIYNQATSSFKSALTDETMVQGMSAQVAAGIKSSDEIAQLKNALYTAGTVQAYQGAVAQYQAAGVTPPDYATFAASLSEEQKAEIMAGVNAQLNAVADTLASTVTTQITSGIAEQGADNIGQNVVAACKESASTAAGQAAGQAAVSGAEGAKQQIAGQIEAVGENGYSLVSGTQALAQGTATLNDKIPSLTAGVSKLSEGVNQIATGSSQLADGSSKLADGTAQLADGSSKLADGTAQLVGGSSQLADGTSQLASGSAQLASGSAQLAAGSSQLADGTKKLADGSVQIADGVSQLNSGANELSDGMNEFNDTAIKKIVETYNGDVKDLAGRLEAVFEASSEYQTFTDINEGDAGITKFIIKTNGITE
ncbi:MAG: hypothetical protein IJV15_03745 [Lachnospiraceae bacterium]|nr:hypothetical protein [Lachnospiraceae bacterium]